MLQINKLIKCLQISLVLLVLMCSAAAGDIIYVDSTATGMPPDGSSWTHAFPYLQHALADADSGDEIWVAAGTYKPDQYQDIPGGNDDPEETFHMENGVEIYGGFPAGGDDWASRDPSTHVTILSGDINTVNSFHVVVGAGTDATAVLDGFTITAGYASGTGDDDYGGGMYNSSSSPTVTNCTFSGNSALMNGGGMYNSSSSPTVTNCTFTGNDAGYGGGMYNDDSSPTVTNCTFSSNTAVNNGGGMYNDTSMTSLTVTNCTFTGNGANGGGGMYNLGSPTVTNCTFTGNSAGWLGGGMSNEYGSPTVTNCTFSGNTASVGGGGMYNNYGSPTVTNCTFSSNTAVNNGGGMYNGNNFSTVNNCIFWGNTASENGPQIAAVDSSTVTIHHCDVQDASAAGVYADGTSSIDWDVFNIEIDPLFVDADGPDNVIGTDDDNLRLLAGSPCINAGDNTVIPPGVTTDLDGNPRIAQDFVDMGAYEYGSAFVDIGLRLYDGIEIVTIACLPDGTLISPLRIAKDGSIYGIFLVDPGHGWASTIRIETASGTKALAKLP